MLRLKLPKLNSSHSEKMASLGQLTAGIAHEINNPINFINSNAVAIKNDIEDISELLHLVNQIDPKSNTTTLLQELIEKRKELDATFLVEDINRLANGINKGGERVAEIVHGLRIYSHTFAKPG